MPDGFALVQEPAVHVVEKRLLAHGARVRDDRLFARACAACGGVFRLASPQRRSAPQPLMARSTSNNPSSRLTASSAIGETASLLAFRAFFSMSATSKEPRRAWRMAPDPVGPAFALGQDTDGSVITMKTLGSEHVAFYWVEEPHDGGIPRPT